MQAWECESGPGGGEEMLEVGDLEFGTEVNRVTGISYIDSLRGIWPCEGDVYVICCVRKLGWCESIGVIGVVVPGYISTTGLDGRY